MMQEIDMKQAVKILFDPVAEELQRHAEIIKHLHELAEKQREMLMHLFSFVQERDKDIHSILEKICNEKD